MTTEERSSPMPQEEDVEILEDVHEVLVSFRSESHVFPLPVSATVIDLKSAISETFSILPEHQKLIAPKIGLLKDNTLSITNLPLPPKKVMLTGSTTNVVENAQAANAPNASSLRKYGGTGPIKAARPVHRVDWQKESESAVYTFTNLNPLQYLPNPERSLTYLKRLRDDPGIRAVMRKHKWTVPLLSEMNPAEHTTHESKTLGLNKNAGEEILLRLRTDSYDGYRDYNTVRKTLCHELAHNVHGPHDRNFWDLFKVIVKEVEQADWLHGGKTVTGAGDGGRMKWDGDAEEMRKVNEADGGGWNGGSFVLGGSSNSSGSGISNQGGSAATMTDRREMAAKAAEDRLKRLQDSNKQKEER